MKQLDLDLGQPRKPAAVRAIEMTDGTVPLGAAVDPVFRFAVTCIDKRTGGRVTYGRATDSTGVRALVGSAKVQDWTRAVETEDLRCLNGSTRKKNKPAA